MIQDLRSTSIANTVYRRRTIRACCTLWIVVSLLAVGTLSLRFASLIEISQLSDRTSLRAVSSYELAARVEDLSSRLSRRQAEYCKLAKAQPMDQAAMALQKIAAVSQTTAGELALQSVSFRDEGNAQNTTTPVTQMPPSTGPLTPQAFPLQLTLRLRATDDLVVSRWIHNLNRDGSGGAVELASSRIAAVPAGVIREAEVLIGWPHEGGK